MTANGYRDYFKVLEVDGLRLVNFATCMLDASKYSVASLAASSQNFLSAASVLNLGMALVAFCPLLGSLVCFGINKPFFTVLISCRNDSNEGVVFT